MKKYILAIACLFTASSVAAAVIDFSSVADGSSGTLYYGIAGGERGEPSFVFTEGGVNVTTDATATYQYRDIIGRLQTRQRDAYSYLDSGNAGLGVCQTLSGTQCAPASDDNVTYGETLWLNFSETVTMNSITFVNGDHETTFAGDFQLAINNQAFGAGTFALENIFDEEGMVGTSFAFYNPNILGGSTVSNDKQFYIQSIDFSTRGLEPPPQVPVPAAAWLFGSGLIGLVGVARRKKV